MGRGFSSSRQSSSYQNAGFATSIINFMKPRCLWRDDEEKEQQQQQQPVNEAKVRALEDWLLASPSWNKNCSNNGGEYYVYRSLSPKVHHLRRRSLYVDKADYMSNSLERLLKVDEVEHEELISSRSISGKAKKRVSFKLPEEADIFIFYSPAEEELGE